VAPVIWAGANFWCSTSVKAHARPWCPSAPDLASATCEARQDVARIACKCCAMKSVLSNIRLCIIFGCFACTGCLPQLKARGFIAGGLQPASYRSVGLVHTTHKGCSYCRARRDLDRCDQMQALSHQKTRLRYMLQSWLVAWVHHSTLSRLSDTFPAVNTFDYHCGPV